MVECRSCLLRVLGPTPVSIYKAMKGGDTGRIQGDAQASHLLATVQPCGAGYFSSPHFWGFVFYAIVREQSPEHAGKTVYLHSHHLSRLLLLSSPRARCNRSHRTKKRRLSTSTHVTSVRAWVLDLFPILGTLQGC